MAATASAPPLSVIETYSLVGCDQATIGGDQEARLSAFIVRLTDVSQKALNQAVAEARQKKSRGQTTAGMVELSSGSQIEGCLSFGGQSSSLHRFQLTDARRELGPNGQLEALEQQPTTVKGSTVVGRWRSVGSIGQRMQISAVVADTFESTKQKAQQASEEMRRNAAKVLKQPAGGAPKVWQKINKVQAPTSQRPLTPLSQQQGGNAGSTKSQQNGGDVGKRPLRQRLLYRLILAPSTSVELLSKLSGEGLTDAERQSFERTLADVAQTRGDQSPPVFEVKRSCYAEIRPDDWPYYTSWERQNCRRTLLTSKQLPTAAQQQQQQQQQTVNANDLDGTQRVNGKISYKPPPKRPAPSDINSNSNSSLLKSPSISPSTSISPPISSSPPRKRPALDDRSTHAADVADDRSGAGNGQAEMGVDVGRRKQRQQHQQHQRVLTQNNNDAGVRQSQVQQQQHPTPVSVAPTPTPTPAPAPATTQPTAPVQQPPSGRHARPTPDETDWQREFPRIKTAEDRKRYKEEFDSEYPIYLKSYDRLRNVGMEFEALGDKLRRSSKGSSEYRDVEKEIFNKYQKFESDSDIARWRHDYERLKLKLGVIKKRVQEYDDRLPLPEPPSANGR